MVMKAVERCASDQGVDVVSEAVLSRAMRAWAEHGGFHSEAKPGQYESD
jgi:hypothetical protein